MTTLLKSDSRARTAPPTPPNFLRSSRMRVQSPRPMAAEIQGGAVAQSAAAAFATTASKAEMWRRPAPSVSTLENSCCISAREMPRGSAEAVSSHCSAVISRSPGLVNKSSASPTGRPAASRRRRSLESTRRQPCCERETRPAADAMPLSCWDAQVKKVLSKLMSTMVKVPPKVAPKAPKVAPKSWRAVCPLPGSGGIPGGTGVGEPGNGAMPGGAAGAGGAEGGAGGARGAPKVLANSA
mmetsp:Transcript_112436/g.350402  ORF Transcript_112436/g.350402 Transcript_112436/m.350402 type:complete len:240 (-) Transcript_112436:844-1563(-)